jgi:DNA-binding MarR family transcriptional regulator
MADTPLPPEGDSTPADATRALADLDRTVHAPGRLLILATLYVAAELDFNYLLGHTGLTRGNLSSHVARLEQEGYVEVHKTFVDRRPLTLYRLTRQGRRAFSAYRRQLLDALEALPDS